MAKKLGILTHALSTNYGGVLQAFALQEVLISLGYDAEIVNLWMTTNNKWAMGLVNNPHASCGARITARIKWLKSKAYRLFNTRYEPATKFRNEHFRLTREIYRSEADLANLAGKLDLLIVGSDQVFLPHLMHLFASPLLPANLPRIAYAASIGDLARAATCPELYRERLALFHSLSCRESSGAEFMRQMQPNRRVTWVCDPVLLPPREFWTSRLRKQTQEPYVAVYWLGSLNAHIPQLIKFAEKEKLHIRLFVGGYQKDMPFKLAHTTIEWAADPLDFISAVAGAKYVISNSFHAFMFSLIFGKVSAFVMPGHIASRARLTDLATRLNCSSCITDEWADGSLPFTDLSTVSGLDEFRNESIAYLSAACESALQNN